MDEQLSLTLTFPTETLTQLWTPDEIYDRLSASNVRQFVEDRRVERKGIGVQAKALAEYLSLWSNTQPHGGLVIVGIENDGTITGCRNLSPEHKNGLESLTQLCPDARWASKELAVTNSKDESDYILVFRVTYRADKLVETSSGDAFIREGDKKLRVSEVLKRELRISKGEIHYELEDVSLKYPEDFDLPEMNKFCRAFFVNRRYQVEKGRE